MYNFDQFSSLAFYEIVISLDLVKLAGSVDQDSLGRCNKLANHDIAWTV